MKAAGICLLPFIWLWLFAACAAQPLESGGILREDQAQRRAFVAAGRFDTLELTVGAPLDEAKTLLGPYTSMGADLYRHAYAGFPGVRVEFDYFNLYGQDSIITRVDLLAPFKAFGLTVGKSGKNQVLEALGDAPEHKFLPGPYTPLPYDGCKNPQSYMEYVCKTHTLRAYFNTADGVLTRLCLYRHDGPQPLDTPDRQPFYGATRQGLSYISELERGRIPEMELHSGMSCQQVRQLLGQPLKERAKDPWGGIYMEYEKYYVYYEPFDSRVTHVVCLNGAKVFGLLVGASAEEEALELFGRPSDLCIGRFYALPEDSVSIDEHNIVYATDGLDLYFDTAGGVITGIFLMNNKLAYTE